MNLLDFPAVARVHQQLFTFAYRAHEAELELIAQLSRIVRAERPEWPEVAAIGIDVGAGTGPYARLLLERCRHVVMIEPNHQQVEYLRRAFGDRATIVEAAAGDAPGTAYLIDEAGGQNWRRPLARVSAEPTSAPWQQPCAIETVDAILARHGLLDSAGALVAKIDVEGNEAAVLQGMTRTLADRPAMLIIEIEARMNPRSNEVFEYLAALGFSAFVYERGQLLTGSHDMVSAMAGRTPGRFGRLSGYRCNFVFLR